MCLLLLFEKLEIMAYRNKVSLWGGENRNNIDT